MKDPQPDLAQIGILIGDPARAAILWALMDGTQRPAGELARITGLSPQAASQHMAKLVDGEGFDVTQAGAARLLKLGIDVAILHSKPRRFATVCLDWTERHYHIGGALGAALLSRFIEMGRLTKIKDSRVLRKTQAGNRGFSGLLDTQE